MLRVLYECMIELCAIQILRCYHILNSLGTFDVKTRMGCVLHIKVSH